MLLPEARTRVGYGRRPEIDNQLTDTVRISDELWKLHFLGLSVDHHAINREDEGS